MNKIVILESTATDSEDKKIKIGIPLSEIKIIEEIPDSNYCSVNGTEINLTLEQAVVKINLSWQKEYEQTIQNYSELETIVPPIL